MRSPSFCSFLGAFAKFAKSDAQLRHVCLPLVRMENSTPIGRIFMIFCTWVFFENLPRKFKTH